MAGVAVSGQPSDQGGQNELKRLAAERAVEEVRPGMVVGLGHGTTTAHAIARLAERIRGGGLTDILGVPCSMEVAARARELGIPLATLEERPVLDLTIDGADEVDPALNLIKGRGGALLREKIVARASRREIIVVDQYKLSPALGTLSAVPVEVAVFGWRVQERFLRSLGLEPSLRLGPDGSPFVTDGGNHILDCRMRPLADPGALDALAERIKARTGVIEHGLFLGLASEVVVAGPSGVRVLRRKVAEDA